MTNILSQEYNCRYYYSMLENIAHMNTFWISMVPSNGMHFVYISNLKFKLVKTIAIKYLIWYLLLCNLKGSPCFYSKVGLYFDRCQMWNDVCTLM
jgi:hypothetical protein